jgi:hypothetical protein
MFLQMNGCYLRKNKTGMSFHAFDFTCGNFTTGRGHFIGSSDTEPRQAITRRLEADGEKNCVVVLGSMVQYLPPKMYTPDITYQVNERWHTAVIKLAATAIPVIISAVISKTNGTQ